MVTIEEIRQWKPLAKMESASADVFRERIKAAMEVELPNSKLVLIPYMGVPEVVEYYSEELLGLCPVTFLPDIYKVRIRFIPDQTIPELKSLKFYLTDFRELPISHEHLASKIYTEVRAQVRPVAMSLNLRVAIRGGIETTIEVGDKV